MTREERRMSERRKADIEKKITRAVLTTVAFMLISMSVFYVCLHARDERVEEQQKVEQEAIEVSAPFEYTEVGDFTLTFYTAGPESTGKSKGDAGYGITKTGATVWENVTVAVDPDVIPLGSYIYIEGWGFYVAQDIGGAIKGNRIDVYIEDVELARELGVQESKVYILSEVM